MAEAPSKSSALSTLFQRLDEEMDVNDVQQMKRLLRGEQVSKEEMKKLESASDVFHHLNNHGCIEVQNLGLLEELFAVLGKDPLKKQLKDFQKEHASTTDPVDKKSTSISSRGKDSNQRSIEGMTGKINVMMDENVRQIQELEIEERKVNLNIRKELLELVRKYVNSVPENDNAKLGECMDKLKEFGADLDGVKRG